MQDYRTVYAPLPLSQRLRRLYRSGGIRLVISRGLRLLFRILKFRFLSFWFWLTPPGRFTVAGKSYEYFRHHYNATWQNERCVEIPIVWDVITHASKAERILEVGNVLGHYFPRRHEVIDKYESGEGVICADVTEYSPAGKYDLIVSVSTLEHVGFDEAVKAPEKILAALSNLRQYCLSGGGRLVVTLPVGYNPAVDQYLREGKISFSKLCCLKKISRGEWVEASWDSIRDAPYDASIPSANAVIVGFATNQ